VVANLTAFKAALTPFRVTEKRQFVKEFGTHVAPPDVDSAFMVDLKQHLMKNFDERFAEFLAPSSIHQVSWARIIIINTIMTPYNRRSHAI